MTDCAVFQPSKKVPSSTASQSARARASISLVHQFPTVSHGRHGAGLLELLLQSLEFARQPAADLGAAEKMAKRCRLLRIMPSNT